MRHSTFCPVPPGIIPVTRRLYEAVLFECIPVITSPTVVAFHTLQEAGDFSVMWLGGNLSGLARHLMDMPAAEVVRKRQNLRRVKPLLLYAEEGLEGLRGHRTAIEGILE